MDDQWWRFSRAWKRLLDRIRANERNASRRNSHGDFRIAIFYILLLTLRLFDRRCYINMSSHCLTDENSGNGVWHTDHTLIIRPSAESVYNISVPKNSWTSQTMLNAPRAWGCFPKQISVNPAIAKGSRAHFVKMSARYLMQHDAKFNLPA